jgi:hypothetical protein
MTMKALPISLLALLLVSGCTIPQYVDRLELALVKRVEENIEARRFIREACLGLMESRMAELEGDALADYLRSQYPPLLTEQAIQAFRADDPSLPALPLVGCQ